MGSNKWVYTVFTPTYVYSHQGIKPVTARIIQYSLLTQVKEHWRQVNKQYYCLNRLVGVRPLKILLPRCCCVTPRAGSNQNRLFWWCQRKTTVQEKSWLTADWESDEMCGTDLKGEKSLPVILCKVLHKETAETGVIFRTEAWKTLKSEIQTVRDELSWIGSDFFFFFAEYLGQNLWYLCKYRFKSCIFKPFPF